MTDSFKDLRNRNKVATVPIPGEIWDNLPPIVQLSMLMMESVKFMAAMHEQAFGGFRVVVMRGKEAEIVLIVGRDEAPPAIIAPGLVGIN